MKFEAIVEEVGAKNIFTSQGYLEEMPFGDEQFDLVVASEVLEHLYEPERFLERLCRLSRGPVLLTVPHEPWFRLCNLLRGRDATAGWIEADELWQADHMDLRDDRIELFGHLDRGQARKVVYAARAVTAGHFTIPSRAQIRGSYIASASTGGTVKVPAVTARTA